MELTVKSGDPKRDTTIASELGEFGFHAFVDKDFFERRDAIQTELEGFLKETEIDGLGLSQTKTLLMKLVQRKRKYVMFHVPSGKAIESPRFGRAMESMNWLLLTAQEEIMCDASDEDVRLVVMDYLAQCETLIGYTFNTMNSTVNKSFNLTQAMPSQGGRAEVTTHSTTDPTS